MTSILKITRIQLVRHLFLIKGILFFRSEKSGNKTLLIIFVCRYTSWLCKKQMDSLAPTTPSLTKIQQIIGMIWIHCLFVVLIPLALWQKTPHTSWIHRKKQPLAFWGVDQRLRAQTWWRFHQRCYECFASVVDEWWSHTVDWIKKSSEPVEASSLLMCIYVPLFTRLRNIPGGLWPGFLNQAFWKKNRESTWKNI